MGGVLSACGDDPVAEFQFGVASGDPLADRVMLWTHAQVPNSQQPVSLQYEVSENNRFDTLVSTGTVVASPETGFTAKADAVGLQPGRTYFYRFSAAGARSAVGQTRTLPESPSSVKLAVMSCTNYPAGFFNVYAEVAKSDCEYAIHLGDYIYEYDAKGYASQNSEQLGRVSTPVNECLSLEDYRRRHAQYKSDADSKALHARMPMIAVWDDHESANDAYTGGAENHSPATEGDWLVRRAQALQAYHEWMPIRTGADRTKIFRSFDFGSLVSLHMLDTRLIGRDKQIEITELAGLAGPGLQAAALAEYSSPTRQLLGTEQQQWLQTELATSPGKWQVLGQQVLMTRMEFPVSALAALNPSNTSPEALAAGQQAIADYLTAKATAAAAPDALTPAQQALLDPSLNPLIGYNLDAWDGYLAARETLLGTVAAVVLPAGKKLIALAGDTHNAWHGDLTLKGLADPSTAGVKIGEEFATSSVSSPGFEEALAPIPSPDVKAIFEGVVDDLNWMDPSRRGYLKMTFSTDSAKGEWIFVDTITSRQYTASLGYTASVAG